MFKNFYTVCKKKKATLVKFIQDFDSRANTENATAITNIKFIKEVAD